MYGSSSLPMMLILLTFAGISQGGDGSVTMELWCVAKNNAEDAALQSAIDWACGPGKADCGPIQQGGPCYDPVDVVRTASYPFNDYYLKNGLNHDSCDFDNTAALTSLNPSRGSCKFPSSTSVGGNTTGSAAARGGFDISCSTCMFSRWNWWIVALISLMYTAAVDVLRLPS